MSVRKHVAMETETANISDTLLSLSFFLLHFELIYLNWHNYCVVNPRHRKPAMSLTVPPALTPQGLPRPHPPLSWLLHHSPANPEAGWPSPVQEKPVLKQAVASTPAWAAGPRGLVRKRPRAPVEAGWEPLQVTGPMFSSNRGFSLPTCTSAGRPRRDMSA